MKAEKDDKPNSLCLHSCCAPCSSYCLLYLSVYSHITVYYYNPNIVSGPEFEKRAAEQQRLISELNDIDPGDVERVNRLLATAPEKMLKHPHQAGWIKDRLLSERHPIRFVKAGFDPGQYRAVATGLENEPERGRRCHACYGLRLKKTAQYALKEGGFDAFATTLTLSPLKDAEVINSIGEKISRQTGIAYMESDFKKKNGYLISIMLSDMFGLYRQNYCGCEYSAAGIYSGKDSVQ